MRRYDTPIGLALNNDDDVVFVGANRNGICVMPTNAGIQRTA